jgi:hypothetical protein
MSYWQRMKDIEAQLAHVAGDPAELHKWRRLYERFTAMPEHAALMDDVHRLIGTQVLKSLLAMKSSDPPVRMLLGKFRTALAEFCWQHRIQCPTAKLMFVPSFIGPTPLCGFFQGANGRLVQLVPLEPGCTGMRHPELWAIA